MITIVSAAAIHHSGSPRRKRIDDEARENPDHEEPAVDRRVVEDGVDPVEPAARSVGVVDAHLRVPEDVARLVLGDSDHREDQRHHRQLDVQRQDPRPRPDEPREHDRQQAEREHEEEQLDRALPRVLRPEQRHPVPGDERSDRPRERAELARAIRIVPVELPGERERRNHDDAVERQEQVRLRRPDVHRNAGGHAGEGRDRQEPRDAQRRPGADRRGEREQHGGGREQAVMSVRREVDGQPRAAERPRREPRDAEIAARCHDEQREPERADRAGGLRRSRAHPTTTVVRAAWVPAKTYRLKTPLDFGARRCSVPRGSTPWRPCNCQRTLGASVETRSANLPPGAHDDARPREDEVADLRDRERIRLGPVPGGVLRRDGEHVAAGRGSLPSVDAAVPGQLAGLLAGAREEHLVAAHEQDRVCRLVDRVVERECVVVPVAVGRDDRVLRVLDGDLRRDRVEPDGARQRDRAMRAQKLRPPACRRRPERAARPR